MAAVPSTGVRRPGPVLRRPHSLIGKAFLAAIALGAAAGAVSDWFDASESTAYVMVGGMPATVQAQSRATSIAMQAKTVLREWKGTSRYNTYDGYIYHKKRLPGLRLKLDRFGTGKRPFYRIKAAFQKRKQNRSGRFLESLGFWDPMRELDDPKALKMKADRCVFWLRNGAQPTDMVASLLDRIGIIRRTGPESRLGEWQWRIPKNSGPEAPEGWSYDGPHEVTWGNKPMINHRKGHPHSKAVGKVPLVEKFGFKGYTKIPVDADATTDPVAGNPLLEAFENTELPIY